jgi:transcriptional regulator
MYIPASFAETDRERLHVFMRRNSFALLTSHGSDGMMASHLPFLLDGEAEPLGVLYGHMARANPQWQRVEGEVMVVFSGPHVYVSPRWYGEAGLVPTWNYVAVHAYGTFHLVEDRAPLLRILRDSVGVHESGSDEPWRFDESADYLKPLLGSIVGFRIEITRLEGKWKLNQNHPEERRQRVARELATHDDENSKAIAALMTEP